MAKVVNCPCGQVMKAETDDELVRQVQQHGKDVHNQEVKREDVLAMARPIPAGPSPERHRPSHLVGSPPGHVRSRPPFPK